MESQITVYGSALTLHSVLEADLVSGGDDILNHGLRHMKELNHVILVLDTLWDRHYGGPRIPGG